jgi:PAS domain S-box-containing protein
MMPIAYKINFKNLKFSREQLAQLLNLTPIPILILGQDDHIEFINEKFIKTFGYELNEITTLNLISKLNKVLDTNLHSQEKNSESDFEDEFNPFELQLTCKDGSITYSEVQFTRMDDVILFAFNDSTINKLIEQDLRTKTEELDNFFTLAIDLLCIADMNGYFIRLNKQWEKTLGYSLEELNYTRFLDYIHPEDMQKTVDAISTLSNNKTVLGFVNRYRCKDGSYKWIEWRSAPLGELIYAVARDITERMNYEKQLNELNATKDKFFSIIAHDLRNPFNLLLGLSEMLIEKSIEKDLDKIEEFSKLIHSASERTFDLLENLLQWSRSQTDKIELLPKYLPLKRIVNDVVRILEMHATQKNIKIQILIEDSIMVYADDNLLKTILRNLISNAIKYTRQGGQVFIKGNDKKTETEITIIDTGVGIETEVISNLFKIASVITTEGTAKEKGSGLGLVLCREFIEKHNGSIKVESQPGEGSKFIFTLPKNQDF